MSDFQEFPKALYSDAGLVIVDDAAAEAEAAARGFGPWEEGLPNTFAAPQEAPPQPAVAISSSGEAPGGAAPSTVAEARAVLDGLGIAYHHRAGLATLLALIPKP